MGIQFGNSIRKYCQQEKVVAFGCEAGETRSFAADPEASAGSGLARAERKWPFSTSSPWEAVYKDYRRYRATGAPNAFAVIALTQGFWASSIQRFSHWCRTHCRIPGLRLLAKAAALILQKFIELATGISIPAQCKIGPGLYIGHFGGIFIDGGCQVGEHCNLSQGVTLGKGGRGELKGVPVLGDRVHVGANAVILGQVSIGNDAVIGPGAVVMSSVPPCGVAMGNPARVVSLAGSFDLVHYDGMENDPARNLALQNQNHGERPEGPGGGACNA